MTKPNVLDLVCAAPLKNTVAPGPKPDPFTVSVKAPEPASRKGGARDVITGFPGETRHELDDWPQHSAGK